MTMTIGQMTAAFHRLILERFRGSAPAGDGVPFLAFELGTPVPDEAFHEPADNPRYSPAIALEYLSHHANVAPLVRDAMFVHTGSTVDGQYELLLFGSTLVDASTFDLFAKVKSSALAAFDETLGSSVPPGLGRFHPVHADPSNWYDQSAGDNWTKLRVEGVDQVTALVQEPGLHPALSTWRLAPAGGRPLLEAPVSIQSMHAMRLAKSSPLTASVATGPRIIARPRRPHDICEVFDPRNTEKLFDCPVPEEPAPRPVPKPIEKPVSSDSFSLTADVCLVHLRRPWLSTNLLALTDWCIPGLARGSMSGGKGTGDAGRFATLPIACVFVRNLAINARWSDDDLKSSLDSTHLGAFSLMGRTFDSNAATLSVPGMQSVAWLCEALPVLPPANPN